MALDRVVLTPEVFLTCTTHALTTEAEEVMGLLLGDIRACEDSGELVAYVRRAVPQIRTDRRKDRVETSPEQMAACSALAEHISTATGLATRVVGWYHSHPHITVLPSHVDVNTQALYQLLDSGFVGLIFSVFNASAGSKEQTTQVTAFQSLPGGAAACALEGAASADLEGLDQQTRAALAASAADMQQATANSWQRREVPISVVRDASNPSTLSDYVELQKLVLAEEQAAHEQHAANSQGAASDVHRALLQLQDAAAHQQALLQHAECVLAPALAVMRQLSRQTDVQEQQLREEVERLQALLAARPGGGERPPAAAQPAAAPLDLLS